MIVINKTLISLGIFFIWHTIYYTASILHVKFCTPKTIYGYFISPLLVTSPQCQLLRWGISSGAEKINLYFGMLMIWIPVNIPNIKKPNKSNNDE